MIKTILTLLCIASFCFADWNQWGGGGGGSATTTDTTSLSNRIDGITVGAHFVVDSLGGTPRVWNAHTQTVDTSGADITDMITYALTNLTSGRTAKERVIVKGTFTDVDRIEVPSYTILDLTQASLTSIDSIPSSKPTGWPNNSFVYAVIINKGYPDDTVRFVEIIGGDVEAITNPSIGDNDKSSCPIAFRHADNLIIRDVYVKGGAKGDGHGGNGILTVYSENVLIDHCIVDSSEYDCIQIDATKNSSVINCTVTTMDTTSAGVGVGGSGIQLSSCSGVSVLNNNLYIDAQSGIRVCHVVHAEDRLNHNRIIGNYIYGDNPAQGIWGIDLCDSTNNCIFSDNHIFDCYYGILLRGSDDATPKKPIGNVFSGNFIYNSRNGVYITEPSNSQYEGGDGNYFVNNTFAKCSNSGGGLFKVLAGSDSNKFTDNQVWAYDNVSGDLVSDAGNGNIFRGNEGWITENKGLLRTDGGNDTITIAHGLSTTPHLAFVTPYSADADSDFYIGALTSTSIPVVYRNATTVGTKNISLSWEAQVLTTYKTTVSAADIEYVKLIEVAPTTNYSTSPTIDIGCWNAASGYARVSLHRPDLSAIPAGATIIQALDSLFLLGESGSIDVEALEVDSNWVEAQATWNIFKTDNNWSSAGGDFSSPDDTLSFTPASEDTAWCVFDVTNIIQAQLDGGCYGIGYQNVAGHVCGASWQYVQFASVNHDSTAYRPRMWIEWTK